MLRQIEHVFCDFHVLDLVEVFLLVPDFVGVPQESPHEAFVEGLQADDVLAARRDDATDGYLIHAADGFPDHRKSVVTNFAVGD
jgi:hypothetical protein